MSVPGSALFVLIALVISQELNYDEVNNKLKLSTLFTDVADSS